MGWKKVGLSPGAVAAAQEDLPTHLHVPWPKNSSADLFALWTLKAFPGFVCFEGYPSQVGSMCNPCGPLVACLWSAVKPFPQHRPFAEPRGTLVKPW